MTINGLRDTSNFVTDQRPLNWREGILLLFPNGKATLTALTSVMSKRMVDDPEFNWWEKELSTQRMELSALLSAGATAIPVTSGALQVKVGTIIYVEESKELILVTADPTVDTSIPTVTRSWGSVVGTAVDPATSGVNPNILIVGNVQEENSDAPSGINYDPTKKFNYTQIFRNTMEISRTAIKTRLRTGEAVREAKREVLEYHSIEMEKAFWHGNRIETTLNGKPARSLGGVIEFIDSDNKKIADVDHATGVSMEHLEEYFYEIFRFGSDEKMGLCGNRSLLTIQQIIRKNSDFQLISGVKEFGMRVARLITPFGEIVLKTMPLWNHNPGGINTTAYYGMESWLAVLDMTNVKYVHLKDSDTKWQPVLQDNGLDGMKSGYLSEVSLEVHHPKTHFLIENLHTAIVDA
jgi:hypothetical protein